jgi:hypothetical protein
MAGLVERRDLPRQILASLRVFRAVPADFDDQLHFLQISDLFFKSQVSNLKSHN